MGFLSNARSFRSLIIIILTPLLLLPLPLLIGTKVAECAFILLVMSTFWMTEALPLAVTALLPALFFPLFGILKSTQVASAYFKEFHLLLAGVICSATSIKKWNLHKRIAMKLVVSVGVNPGWLMLGFMTSSAFLSMWLNNTSTTAMLMPIVEVVLQQIMNVENEVTVQRKRASTGCSNGALQLDELEEKNEKINIEEVMRCNGVGPKAVVFAIPEGRPPHSEAHMERGECYVQPISVLYNIPEETPGNTQVPIPEPVGRYRSVKDHMMCKGLSLCIAYSTTIGGLTTLTGTSTNLIFNEQMNEFYPECNCINFGNWFLLCLPITVIILLLSWVWLHWMFLGNLKSLLSYRKEKSEREKATQRVIEQEYNALGPMSTQEKVTLTILALMVLLWLVRNPGFMPGWAALFPQYSGYATDATVALLLGLMFFIIPANNSPSPQTETLVTWKEFQSCMPWEICLLVGGGFALAEGIKVSGLSIWLADLLIPLGRLPIWLITAITCGIVSTFTEVASNPATITIFAPILAPMAEVIRVNPLLILIPTTLCTSFAFLLPVSNPPNAIVFTYGHVNIIDMVKAGLGLKIIGLTVVLLGVASWGVPLFGLNTYPDWAPIHATTNTTGL
ncbi:solute carrier family 13 member 1 [Anguilla rostrata]|nr:solute carrier family 13 member 1 [Anguilla anguilla]